MTLSPGSRLGPYEIVAPLGAGGMGEVYKARDTRLDRTVAVKVLPSHLSEDPALRQRFEREARAVSQLSHPHICTLHDIGHQEGVDFLVMEYLEGEALADRLSRGALPIPEVLRTAIEIADALDKAHRQGVIHRDLKPGNVMLTKAGAKLLDFGLAKTAVRLAPSSDLTESPTLSRPLTAEGSIVGTFQYMAPEQLEGSEADARSDIFAFGALLYEMATGERAFGGQTQASLIASILKEEPRPISELQPLTPPALERLVRTCLAKDPDERWQSAHDLRAELEWIAEAGSQAGVAAPVARRRRGRERLWMASTAVLLASLAALAWAYIARAPEARGPVRLSLVRPASAPYTHFQNATISPDGRRIAFVAYDREGGSSLWIRPLASEEARRLPGTEGAQLPFWSPDGRFLGFFAGGKLQRIDAAGGPPQTICDAPQPQGGSWSPDGVIVFAPREAEPLYRVPAAGGAPERLTRLAPEEEAHRWPYFLADGRRFVFLADADNTENHNLRIGSLDSEEAPILIHGISNVAFAPPRHVLFVRAGALVAQPIHLSTLEPDGPAVALADGLVGNPFFNHLFEFSVSRTGVLTHRSASPDSQLAWVDREGSRLATVSERLRLASFQLSRDGRRLAFDRLDADRRVGDIWVLDLERGLESRLTFHAGADRIPVWSPDGERIAFVSGRDGREDLYAKAVDRAGNERLLFRPTTGETEWAIPTSWSPDGRTILFEGGTAATGGDLWALDLGREAGATLLLQTPFNEWNARFSPTGTAIAYASDESGQAQIYVQAFPELGGRIQVSASGGWEPRWRADGGELFFVAPPGRLMAVEIHRRGQGFEVGPPRELFTLPGFGYAPAPDGERFLVDAFLEPPWEAPVTVVLDWHLELPGP